MITIRIYNIIFIFYLRNFYFYCVEMNLPGFKQMNEIIDLHDITSHQHKNFKNHTYCIHFESDHYHCPRSL